MRFHRRRLVLLAVPIVASAVPPAAAADTGFYASPRTGVETQHADLAVGAELMLAFDASPLRIRPAFDYYFAGDLTLFHVGIDALYAVSGPRLFAPYAGVGIGVTRFSGNDEGDPGGDPAAMGDSHGGRVALDLIGGVCFDLPVVAPYVEVSAALSAIDLVTVAAGLRFRIDGGGGGWDGCGRPRPRAAGEVR